MLRCAVKVTGACPTVGPLSTQSGHRAVYAVSLGLLACAAHQRRVSARMMMILRAHAHGVHNGGARERVALEYPVRCDHLITDLRRRRVAMIGVWAVVKEAKQ